MARYGYAKKVVNAGGMTENQVKKILELGENKAWDLHPSQKMREFYALHIGDVESNPATSVLTGGWEGTASKLIASLLKLPNVSDVRTAHDIAITAEQSHQERINNAEIAAADDTHYCGLCGEDATHEIGKCHIGNDPWDDGIPNVVNHDTGETENEVSTDPKFVGPGVYLLDNLFFSVKESTKNPGRFYAHQIKMIDKKFKHVYAPGVIYKLTEEMRVSGELVVKMNRETIHERNGKRVGSCCVCGRMLTKKASIDAGIGPVCGGRVGL